MKKLSFQEGIDYYVENGNYVFTEHYLKCRGYCCKHGCRHCPFGYKKNELTPKSNINKS